MRGPASVAPVSLRTSSRENGGDKYAPPGASSDRLARAKSQKCAGGACSSNDARRGGRRRRARDAKGLTFFRAVPVKGAGEGVLLPALPWPTPNRRLARYPGGGERSIDRCRRSISRCL